MRSTYFLFTPRANDALKHKKFFSMEDAKKLTHRQENTTRARARKKRREHFYALLRASVYTRTHYSHARCNLIALNASHNIHLHIVSHILSAYFLGRGFACMFVCRKTDALTDAQRTTSMHNERHRTRKRHKRANERDRRGIVRL